MCLAIPGRVLSIETENEIRIGRVQFSGVVQAVALDFVPEVVVGDFVMVHVGFAISRVDEEEAEATLHALELMGLLEAELPPGDEVKEVQERT
jgi:hydrogenase expression/formation protein HypC